MENICHLPDIEQAEIIADNFSRISNSYNPIDPDKICTSQGNEKSTPKVEAFQVYEFLKKIKTNTATVKDDIPAKLIKEFAPELSDPLANIINCMVERGEFPHCWKLEMVTPAAKKFPSSTFEDLRKISGLKNFSKIAEKYLGTFLISDMSENRDVSRLSTETRISVNHYLINMIH